MSKHFNIEDPVEMEKWTRYYYHIDDDESTDEYLIRRGFLQETPSGYVKRINMALAWLEPQLTANTRSIWEQIKLLVTEYDQAASVFNIWPRIMLEDDRAKLLEEAKALNEKVITLFNNAIAIHRLQPIIDAQEKYKQEQSERASKPRKLTESENIRIAKQYWERKKDGEGYGAAKALAATYNVSETTIHNIVKKHKQK